VWELVGYLGRHPARTIIPSGKVRGPDRKEESRRNSGCWIFDYSGLLAAQLGVRFSSRISSTPTAATR
jgi:hypothetical protein